MANKTATINRDYANADGNKIKRIMRGGATEYFAHPHGVIMSGRDYQAIQAGAALRATV